MLKTSAKSEAVKKASRIRSASRYSARVARVYVLMCRNHMFSPHKSLRRQPNTAQ